MKFNVLKNTIAAFCGSVLMSVCSTQALAWDGIATGVVAVIEVTDGNNYGMRVHYDPAEVMCENGSTWAYINEDDSNYDTYVSVLLSAKLANREVTIFSRTDAQNYCKIGHMFMR